MKIPINLKVKTAHDIVDLEEYCQREWGVTLTQKIEQEANIWLNRALHTIADHKAWEQMSRLEGP